LFYTADYKIIVKARRCVNMEQIVIPDQMKPIVNFYYRNQGKQLYSVVDKLLMQLHFVDVDKSDFYSLANEVFLYAVRDYDSSKPFDSFLSTCLYKKFCTEMTRRHREKRRAERMSVSLDMPVGEDEDSTIGDMIADEFTIEREFFERKEEAYSQRMRLYLSRLSDLQKKVLGLNMDGYLPGEIKRILRLSEKQYADCCAAIHSYRNVSVLF